MKYFIKIEESFWVLGSNTKMIYKDEKGKRFLGSPISFTHGETIIVEASVVSTSKCRIIRCIDSIFVYTIGLTRH